MTVDYLSVESIKPHPDNPRLFLRDEVIEGIAAQIEASGEFDPAHALLVRPVNGHYQILRGHHRIEAAKKAGLDSVPCWVREMGDDEAYMQLALSNVQGELSPLEIGIHALRAVDIVEGGRGLKGGISAYSQQIQVDRSHISKYRNAAVVLNETKNLGINAQVLEKALHLAAIHKTPQQLWPILVQWLITPKNPDKPDSTPSAKQTEDLVKEVNKFTIPEKWQQVFLNLPDVISAYIQNGNPASDLVGRLANAAESIEQLIASNGERINDNTRFPYTVEGFHEWLKEGVPLVSWNEVELSRYRQDVIQAAQEAMKPAEPDPKLGEWWQLGRHLLYCGDTGKSGFWEALPKAQFAFADPPYNAGAADWDSGFEWNHDWLIDKADVVAVTPGIESIASFFREDTTMPYAWSMASWIKNGMTRGKVGYGNWIYIALFSTLESIYKKKQDVIEVTIKTSKNKETDHKGRKPSELLEKLLDVWTDQNETVIDPFLGSGTTLYVAEQMGRTCIGGEVRPDFCKIIIMNWQEMTGQVAEKRR